MKHLRHWALGIVIVIFFLSLLAEWFSPASYSTQFRDSPDAPPSGRFPLGTDELGRDRLARLIYGTRVSLCLAPTAAMLATLIAALLGGIAGYVGGHLEKAVLGVTDLFLSLPWLFLLLTVRASLPLNTPPLVSVLITFLLLGLLGWAGAARVVCAGMRSLRNADFILQARACGCGGTRLLLRQLLPNLKPVLAAQFWISVPIFILTEANLSLLGLGVAEPLPSWGGLLRELESNQNILETPWRLAPLLMLVVVVGCFQILLQQEEAT